MNNDISKAPQRVNVIVLLLGHCVTSIFSLTDVKAAGLRGTVQMIKVENCWISGRSGHNMSIRPGPRTLLAPCNIFIISEKYDGM